MILNENELETDRKTSVEHTKSGRKEREVIRSGPVPREGTRKKRLITQKKRLITQRPSWAVQAILGLPALGSNTGRPVSLVGWVNRMSVGGLASTCEEHRLACLQLRQGERASWNHTGGWLVSCDCPAHGPAWTEQTLQLHLPHITLHTAEDRTMLWDPPAGLHLRWNLSRVGTATVGAYTGIRGSLDLSDSDQTTTPCTPALTKYPNTLSQTQLSS